ncbi:bifunctional 5,10-methylenetetrahydrofolate dehydrogenase/5,10-methenyltetrahydrofolate cyclohydrolase [Adlercreutzia sp. ZJ154]|uniref:bifunctional 5,10-methylenetetrahydrofolate dehydrogenase/5,10-methenyltetrahydrofolate cyclohydrolase n=1 Tax=Adlercreutzia sp. ZJ154 TaxID=2709790 RepID=UPI0013ED4E6B|nr:bifunctional 5,10-methylenetetrahydrofolate dehydrogenase/5,10-methenyltetrahydrofolate cyclohydrolase [Adlercreutzia sp. ZJ154]
MAQLLKGKPVADAIYSSLKNCVQAQGKRGMQPCLALVRVGNSSSDAAYQRSIISKAESIGIKVNVHEFESGVSQFDVEAVLESINADKSVHGCMIFRPLPNTLDELHLCNKIAPEKDIDGVCAASLAGIFADVRESFSPCTAQACVEMLDYYGIDIAGRSVAVLGRSLVVGKPAAMLMLSRNATVTLCHSGTANLSEITRAADIVICATGRARAYGEEYFRAGHIVLDVGTNTDSDGMLCGDVDFAAVEPIVSAITPVPGGIGSVTTAVLLKHVVMSSEGRA